jgi:hypothetical protein
LTPYGCSARQLVPAVEPDALDLDRGLDFLQKRDHAQDVVEVDVRHYEQVDARAVAELAHEVDQVLPPRFRDAAIDQDAKRLRLGSVLDPEGVAALGGKHAHPEAVAHGCVAPNSRTVKDVPRTAILPSC